MQFDLAPRLDTVTASVAGAWVELTDLRGAPLIAPDGTRVAVRVLGPDSRRYREALRQTAAEQAKAEDGTQDTATAAFFARMTLDWRGVTAGGAAVPCTPDAVRAFYDAFPAVLPQIDRFVSDRGNFLPGAAGNSSNGPAPVSAPPAPPVAAQVTEAEPETIGQP